MKFDATTIREELAAVERKLELAPKDRILTNSYVSLARKLREIEHESNGYVTARSSVTGY